MKLSQRLTTRQSQSLVMTPQLVQSIKLLQLGNAELAELVHEEIEKNPLLEFDPDTSDRRRTQSDVIENPKQVESSEQPLKETNEIVSTEMTLDAGRNEQEIDASFENVYDKDTPTVPSRSAEAGSTSHVSTGSDETDFLSLVGERQSLTQFLEMQIACTFKDTLKRKIANYIAHTLDDDGYFRESASEVARGFGSSVDIVLEVLERFQQFEPVGIGAENLAKCLEIQLRDRNRHDPAMAELIKNLDLLAKRDFRKLMKLCRVDEEDLHDMIMEIRELDPRPAIQFEDFASHSAIPDVLVRQRSDGGWAIELNPEALPKALINHQYHAELSQSLEGSDGMEFVNECLGSANWLIKSLEQRAQTILKVATEIVRQQDMFLAKGVEHMRPLNLKTVAEAVKMHESTISRVTNSKFMLCDQGMFELKYFFTNAIASKDGEETCSAETVRHKIRQLVDSEDPARILSDDQIVTQLQETGIDIARRTVAKYREAMRIPSSVQRRRDKKDSLRLLG